MKPNAEIARSVFRYDAETGFITFVESGRNHRAGDRAGHYRQGQGYRTVCMLGRNWLEHRVIWLMVHGNWPVVIDHINGVRDDNRLANLREVDQRINNQNQRVAFTTNKLGLLGVCLCKATGRYIAQIGVGGRNIKLGRYSTPELAHVAYLEAKRQLHEGCTL